MSDDRLPLDGVRVVEFSHMIMGPSSGLVLGDLGADVIKIEPVGEGDKTRKLLGSGAGFFPTFNRNKRSLAVDIKSEQGIEIVRKLIQTADVLTENFRPGALETIGLGYDALATTNPGLVYCSLKGFLAGPYENRPALDEVVQMMGGLAHMTGPPGRPLRAGTSVNDIMGGMFAVIGILAALWERARTGRGQLVKSALFENNVFLVAQHMMQFAVTGQPAAPMPERIAAWAVYDVFDTRDEQKIFVGVVSDTQWRAFCEEFGGPQLLLDASLATNRQRVEARGRLIPSVQAIFAQMTRKEIIDACERARLPFAPIMKPEDLFDDPHLSRPGAMIDIMLSDGRTTLVPALPIEMNGRRCGRRLNVPRLGEHSASIALELGYKPSFIDKLAADGVIGLDVAGSCR